MTTEEVALESTERSADLTTYVVTVQKLNSDGSISETTALLGTAPAVRLSRLVLNSSALRTFFSHFGGSVSSDTNYRA